MTEWNPNQRVAVSQYLQQVKVGNMESKCKYENGKAHLKELALLKHPVKLRRSCAEMILLEYLETVLWFIDKNHPRYT